MSTPSPAVLTVGDELIFGERSNGNQTWLLATLQARGYAARYAISAPDQIETIALAIQWLRQEGCDPILVSGGIGGTHDDLTRDGIAAALQRPLEVHPECDAILGNRYGDQYTPQRRRMATLPRGCRLIANPLGAPGFHCDGVYAFPGFPNMLQPMLESLLDALFPLTPTTWHTEDVVLPLMEGAVASTIEAFSRNHPQARVGLYPSAEKFREELTIRLRCPAGDTACRGAFQLMIETFKQL